MLRRFKQRAAEEFGPLAPRARPALITTESKCQEYRVAFDLIQTFPNVRIDAFLHPDRLEQVGSRQIIADRTAEIRAALNKLRNEQRRAESLIAESPQAGEAYLPVSRSLK
jgi:hypothetical protein